LRLRCLPEINLNRVAGNCAVSVVENGNPSRGVEHVFHLNRPRFDRTAVKSVPFKWAVLEVREGLKLALRVLVALKKNLDVREGYRQKFSGLARIDQMNFEIHTALDTEVWRSR
jgi:hypothetical protein